MEKYFFIIFLLFSFGAIYPSTIGKTFSRLYLLLGLFLTYSVGPFFCSQIHFRALFGSRCYENQGNFILIFLMVTKEFWR